MNEKHQITSNIEDDSILANAGINNESILIEINKQSLKRKKVSEAMKVLKRQKDKRPLKLVFTIESKEEEEDKVNKDGSEEGDTESGQQNGGPEDENKYTSLWLKESEVSHAMFDDSHFFNIGSEEFKYEFEEWCEDESFRLKLFGQKLAMLVLKALEKRKKEEKEKKKDS